MRIRTLVAGGLIGAAIAYLFDPVSGRGRRAQLRDRGLAETRRMRERAEARKRHLSNVTHGAMSEMSSPGPDDRHPDDTKISQRIPE